MKLSIQITGIRPLIMHNGRLANPLDPWAKALKKLTSMRTKTDETYEQMAQVEWEGGAYWDDELGFYVPSDNIEAMFERGARKLKLGEKFKSGFICDAMALPLVWKYSRNYAGAKADNATRLQKMCVVNQKTRVLRTRVLVHTGWKLTIPVEFDATVLQRDQVDEVANLCGLYVGLGDWRPKFGRFLVDKVEDAK